jgi:hypothetical protein
MAKNTRQKNKMIPKKVTLITPPDILPNRTQSILLITPNSDIKDFLDHYLKTFNANIHVYLYTPLDVDIKWLLTVAVRAEAVILDCDNAPDDLSHFLSYIISMPNTYYRVTNPKVDYSIINPNRFYDFPNLNEKLRSL